MVVSVVIPTFNRSDLITETLDSILRQTRPADEIVVVDDGSTDETRAVLSTYSSSIKVVTISNSGELAARNAGVRAAGGRFVAFCDSDDLWQPTFLAKMLELFARAPGLVAGYCDFKTLSRGAQSVRSKFDAAPPGFWESSRPLGEAMRVFERSLVDRVVRFQPFFNSCMMVDRQKFLDLGGWDEGVGRGVGCDLATTLRLAAAPPVGVIAQPLAIVRRHDNNFSANVEAMNLGDAHALDYVLATRPALAPLAKVVRESAARRRCAALASAFARQDFTAVRMIDGLIPQEWRTLRHRVKAAVAALPHPTAGLAATLLSRVSEARIPHTRARWPAERHAQLALE